MQIRFCNILNPSFQTSRPCFCGTPITGSIMMRLISERLQIVHALTKIWRWAESIMLDYN